MRNLNNDRFVLEAGRHAEQVHVVFVVHEHARAIEYAAAGSRYTTVNATRDDRLAGDARIRILLLMTNRL